MLTETKISSKNSIFRFRDFPVYLASRELRKELKSLSKTKFPKVEQYALTRQLWRALDSILLNIAEGTEKYSDVDFSRFLNTSLGSLNEVVACLEVAEDGSYISGPEHEYFLAKLDEISRQLKAFSSKVRKTPV